MEKFKFKYATYHYILLVAGLLLSVGCIVYNVVNLLTAINKDLVTAYKIITFSVVVIVSVASIVIFVSMLISSCYVLDDKGVSIKFGVIKTFIEYKKIKQVVLFASNNKLTIFLSDETFDNIVIDRNEYQAFVKALLDKNPKIVYLDNYEDETEKE